MVQMMFTITTSIIIYELHFNILYSKVPCSNNLSIMLHLPGEKYFSHEKIGAKVARNVHGL